MSNLAQNPNQFENLKKPTWQERAKRVASYHAFRCRENPDHTIADTAKELARSVGRISEDITIANWIKTHPRIEKLKNPTQALNYIKQKKEEMKKNG